MGERVCERKRECVLQWDRVWERKRECVLQWDRVWDRVLLRKMCHCDFPRG